MLFSASAQPDDGDPMNSSSSSAYTKMPIDKEQIRNKKRVTLEEEIMVTN